MPEKTKQFWDSPEPQIQTPVGQEGARLRETRPGMAELNDAITPASARTQRLLQEAMTGSRKGLLNGDRPSTRETKLGPRCLGNEKGKADHSQVPGGVGVSPC
jgi:hypothetical protein